MATTVIGNLALAAAVDALNQNRFVGAVAPASYANQALVAAAFKTQFLAANTALVAPMADADNANIGTLVYGACRATLAEAGIFSQTATDYAAMANQCAALAKQCVAQLS